MRNLLLLILFAFCPPILQAQELYAKVQIQAPTVSNINKSMLSNLQLVVSNFLNNTRWTQETYLSPERIPCVFVITVTSWDGGSTYQANAQIQSTRAVYGSSYQSTLLNLSDKDFNFNYIDGQPLEFSTQVYQNNLSSLLSFYAYTIIGLDKDSFSNLGGTNAFLYAQQCVNLAQNQGFTGWNAIDGLRNRYWLNENLLNPTFEKLRVFSYGYHRKGLDLLQSSPAQAARQVFRLLPTLKELDRQKIGSIFPNSFFQAKAEELVRTLALTDRQEQQQAHQLLMEIDPANGSTYDRLLTSR